MGSSIALAIYIKFSALVYTSSRAALLLGISSLLGMIKYFDDAG